MFFSKSKTKPKPTGAHALAEFRKTLTRAVNDAEERGVQSRDVIFALENAAQNLRVQVACTTACPEAVSAGLYDVNRLAIIDKPKPAPAARRAQLPYPQSNDAVDVASYWAEMETRQRGR